MTTRGLRLPRELFVDTGAFYATVDPRDEWHSPATAFSDQLADAPTRLYTTNFVLAETHALVLRRRGRMPALQLLDALDQGGAIVIRVTSADEHRARAILHQHQDKEFSLTDATSFAVMERLGLTVAFAFDRNFHQYRFQMLPEQPASKR